MLGSLVTRLRRPEYTGENRCLPCTVLNVGIASVGATLLGAWFVAAGYSTAAVGVSTGVLAVSLAAIWLRGYLVPGTPALTKRYLPASVLAAFGKTPEASPEGIAAGVGDGAGGGTDASGAGAEADDDAAQGGAAAAASGGETNRMASEPVDPEALLERAGAIEPCRGDDRCLTANFEEAWRAEIDAIRADDDLGPWLDRFGLDDGEVTTKAVANAFAVSVDGRRVGSWESQAAFHADLAAATLLADRLPGWAGLSARDRGQVCNGLRIFLETCPDCDSPVSFGTETVESCCTSRTVAAVTCDDCGARVFESPVDDEEVAA
ncbi:hypothetical protein C475_05930 [Halosimplex carlsbadense 2-9-1]|uniref:Uncharacterized protein n=1 Tax=Halosimplex carlsbadense 2-9-1 TaxID=797114 RepID=M0CZX1_9EURY|nr:hypothetical protein [Halosimplex carlsbadense]ELZ27434.1 hypothetical protein C475_05930 [Halosimplex carlsbadense 2-9-1]